MLDYCTMLESVLFHIGMYIYVSGDPGYFLLNFMKWGCCDTVCQICHSRSLASVQVNNSVLDRHQA